MCAHEHAPHARICCVCVCVCVREREREREIKVYFLYYLGRQDQGQLTIWELGAAGEDGLLGEQK